MTLFISSVNTAPVAPNAIVSAIEDTLFNGILPAYDPDGTPLTYILDRAPAGTVILSLTGAYAYTPLLNSNIQDSFAYHVNDGIASSST